MNTTEITLISDFTVSPGGRSREQGKYSGQQFREDLLVPALQDAAVDSVIVDLDGAFGLPSSFLDESFGVAAETYPEEFEKLHIVLTDNDVARSILEDCIEKHGGKKFLSDLFQVPAR